MKRILVLFACFLLIFGILEPVGEVYAADISTGIYAGMKLKIGLNSGTNGMMSANLQNATGYGSGYRIGYYDQNRNFNYIAYIYNVEITVNRDTTYHVQQPMGFNSFEEATVYAQSIGNAFAVFQNNSFFVRSGSYANYQDAQNAANAAGGSAVGASKTCFTITDTNSASILFEFDVSGVNLGIEPIQNSIEVPETWFKGYKYYGGFEYQSTPTGLTVINVVDIETYVKGVIPYEMNNTWPIEALKAQAIGARTYAVKNIGRHAESGFDMCSTVDCQVYQGCKSANANTDSAVDATRGMCIVYNGEPIQAVYHASNGGATENSENVWYDMLPYLRAVADDFESTTNMTYKSWEYEVTNKQITNILRERGNDIGDIVKAYAEYTDVGNVKALYFIDSNGKKLTYAGEKARLVLRSDVYNINTSSQRFIFEDKKNPRVTSVSQFAKPNAAQSPAASNSPVLSNAYNTFVLSAFNSLSLLSNKYTSGIYVLSKDGTAITNSVYSMGSGGNVGGGGSASGGVNASSLKEPASVSGTYIIAGGGNGHNLGMSQYGAKAMAEQNRTAEQILMYYYTGVNIVNYYN